MGSLVVVDWIFWSRLGGLASEAQSGTVFASPRKTCGAAGRAKARFVEIDTIAVKVAIRRMMMVVGEQNGQKQRCMLTLLGQI